VFKLRFLTYNLDATIRIKFIEYERIINTKFRSQKFVILNPFFAEETVVGFVV
jgi:hypothetical protein